MIVHIGLAQGLMLGIILLRLCFAIYHHKKAQTEPVNAWFVASWGIIMLGLLYWGDFSHD